MLVIRSHSSRYVAVLMMSALMLSFGGRVAASQNPTQRQIQTALATKPGLAGLVRSKIQSSGLSPDQIRDRLKASGYSSNLLDAYMSDSVTTDSMPNNDVMRAARFLGLVDSAEVAAAAAGLPLVQPVPAPSPPPAPATPFGPTSIFGLDVFRRSTSQFEPDIAGPVDANYRVGPRDVLALIITGGVENSYSLEVTREGFIVIPNVGQVYVANLTLDQVNDVLFDRLKRVYSGIGKGPNASTHFYVTVAKLRTNQVFVVGEASAPGSYQVSSAGTILTALYGAGGPTDNGSLRDVQLQRDGKTITHLDVYDYLLNGDASHDARLETGDVIFIPVHGARVEVRGQVTRPATYELTGNESLRDALRMAGGFTAQAARRRVLVRRIVPPSERSSTGGRDRTVIDVTSDEFATGFGPALPLVNGDVIEVSAVPDRVRNEIAVDGAVWAPGMQGFRAGMRLSDAIRQAGGVKPDVKDVLISRLQSDQSRLQLRAQFVDSLGGLAQDLPLQEDDSIEVFSISDFRPDRYVRISGAVNKGGKYPWREGMTLRDLVHLAGGFDDGAYLVDAQLARLPEVRKPGQLARTITVPLDSSYLLERGLNGKYVGPPVSPPRLASAPPVLLEPYDNVLILREPDWQLDRVVTVLGEVQFPGDYTMTSKQERLSDLLRRAGGLTPRAYPGGARFIRPFSSLGRVGLELDRVLNDSTDKDNLVLLPGDTLYIPPYRPTVKIEGAVHSSIAVAYVPGKKMQYYIEAAGGSTFNADDDRAYVEQPDGVVEPHKSRWFLIPDSDPSPLPGSTVVVPQKDPNDKKDWTSISASIAQIIVSSVAIIALVKR